MRVDAALPAMMSLAGIDPGDQRRLMVDAATGDTTALAILEGRMGLACEADFDEDGDLRCAVPLGGDVVWTGGMLIMPGVMPTTVCGALEGRLTTEVVQHPALPERVILSARPSMEDGTTMLVVERDMRPYTELLGECHSARMGGMPRRTMRRHRAAVGTGSHYGVFGLIVATGIFMGLTTVLLSVIGMMAADDGAPYPPGWSDHPALLGVHMALLPSYALLLWSLPIPGGRESRRRWVLERTT